MVTEGDIEMAMEDESSDLGTEVSTDDEMYDLETEEATDESEAEAKETVQDEIQCDEVRAKRGLREKINGSKPRDIRRYCCQICGLVRSKRNRIKVHIMSHHGVEVDTESKIDKLIEKKNPEDCEFLESEVKKSRKAENSGGSKPRDIRRYCCQICGLIRSKRKRLKVHIMVHHGVEIDTAEIDKLIEKKNPEECEILESEAKKRRKVENGFKARELRSYSCTLCGLVRSKRELLKNHIILEHSEETDTKDEIDKFIQKRRSEDDQRCYSCQICGVLRSKRVLLKFHMISSHGLEALKRDKRFASDGTGKHLQCVCNMCGMSFSKPSHLQQHNLSHSALEGLRHLALLSTRWETALEELGY